MKRIPTTLLLFGALLIAAAPVAGQVVTSTGYSTAQVDKEAKAALKKGQEADSEKVDSESDDAKSVKKKSKKAKLSPQRMTHVLDFVNEHHPELAGMLELLQESQPGTFTKAVNGINASVGKLEALKTRKPDRYAMALKRWKLTSRINVASAKLKRKDSEANRKELESLLSEQADFHVETLKADRERFEKRMAQIDKQIAESESAKSDQIKRRIEAVRRGGNRKKKKPATPKEE